MTNKREQKRSYWSGQIKQWQASGETRSGYCRVHGLKLHQLTYWAQVFESPSRATSTSSANGFVAVRVAESAPQDLAIRLPNGFRLEGVHARNLAVAREIVGWLA